MPSSRGTAQPINGDQLVKPSQRPADNYSEGGHTMAEFTPELLRQARELGGLTAAKLAARAGLHRVTVANYERGMHCPAETWERIERALRAALEEHTGAVAKVKKRL